MGIICKKISLLLAGLLIVFTNLQSANAGNANDEKNNNSLSRILGGANAVEGQFPHHISLRAYNQHLCSGSIISQNYVVTAAHCIEYYGASLLEIRAGSTLEKSDGVIIKVAQTIIHPDYKQYRNDIALLKLSQSLKFNDRIKAIPLANKEVPSTAPVIVSGWGYTKNGVSNGATHLQYTIMIAISFTECQNHLIEIIDLAKSELCLKPINSNGACSGDSGGPAVYNGNLVGVAKWIVGSCGSSYPDGYSSTVYNLKWLKENSDV